MENKKEDKYYTPTIEEFHVGFEYEVLETKPVYNEYWKVNIRKEVFTPKHLHNTYPNVSLEVDLKNGKVRVKYLDSEDIKELGWRPSGISNFGRPYYKKCIAGVEYTMCGSKYSVEIWSKVSEKHVLGGELFKGVIKNKSELKRLLKQLQIND